jgi:diguanylate cyclase
MLFKKNNPAPHEARELFEKLGESENKNVFFLSAIRALLVFLKDFSLDLKEIESDRFKQRIDELSDLFVSDDNIKKIGSKFKRHKKYIPDYINRQEKYLKEREQEFRDIIDLMTRAMVTLDSDNQEFNEKIYAQSEKIEAITLLDDIRKIKVALAHEVEHTRRTIREKQDKENRQMEVLAQKVETLNRELKKTKEESQKDGLTGINNRKALDAYLRNLVERNNITRLTFSLLLIDIDDFKAINDTYGHQAGDGVLVSLTSKISGFIRSDDFIGRYGGEEFVLILPGASLRNANKKAKQICKTISSTRFIFNDIQLKLTISIGVSSFKKGDTAFTVVERADHALYAAKKMGKNRSVTEKAI